VNLTFLCFVLIPSSLYRKKGGEEKTVCKKGNSVGSLTMQVFGGVAQQNEIFLFVCILPQAPCRNFFFACKKAILLHKIVYEYNPFLICKALTS